MNMSVLAGICLGVAILPGVAEARQAPPQPPPWQEGPGVGYFAVVRTTVGAVAPLMTRHAVSQDETRTLFHIRYGNVEHGDDHVHAVAATGEFRLGRGRLAAHAGVQSETESTRIMVGLDYQQVVSRVPIAGAGTPPLVIVVKPELSLAPSSSGRNDETYFTSSVNVLGGMPFGGDITFVPFVGTGFTFGLADHRLGRDKEIVPSIAGGLVIHNPSRIDLTLAFHKVIVEGSRPVLGAGLTWNR